MAKKTDIKDLISQYKTFAKEVLRFQVIITFTAPTLGLDVLEEEDPKKLKKLRQEHKNLFAEILYLDDLAFDFALTIYRNSITNDIDARFRGEEHAELLNLVNQLVKNFDASLKNMLTRERRKHQICKTFDIKVMAKRQQKQQLMAMRREAKNIYNYILDVGVDNFDCKSDEIEVLNPVTGEREKRKIEYVNQQTRQAILSQIKDALSSLSSSKEKGRRVGRLKFKRQIDMIPLKQYGKTHYFLENKKRVKICGVKKSIYVRGLEQIEGWEIASAAKLVFKADGIHLMVTCYKDKDKINETNHKYRKRGTAVSFDFGVGDALTFGDDTRINLLYENSEAWRNAERDKSHKKQGSSGRKKAIGKVQLAALRDSNKKDDGANKTCAIIAKNEICFTQDDDFSGWKEKNSLAHGSKKIQAGTLGRTKAKLKERGGVYMIDRWMPTTQVCPRCHEKTKHELDEQGNVTCSHCHFMYPRNAGAAWSMEYVATEQFGDAIPDWFSPIDASGSVEETLALARKRSAWDPDMTRDISDPRVLDAILGHVDDKSHVGEDMSGRVRPRVKSKWTSKKKTRGKQDKWSKYSRNYDIYVCVGSEPEHADEPVAMKSSRNSKNAKKKRNLDHRRRQEAKRAIYFRDARKRRAEREHARCEARDARRLENAAKGEKEEIAAKKAAQCTPGTGGINAGGDRLSRCESAVTLPCRGNQKPPLL